MLADERLGERERGRGRRRQRLLSGRATSSMAAALRWRALGRCASQHATEPQPVLIRGYLRQEGLVQVPPQAVVQTVTARILQGGAVKALHTIKL